MFTNIFFCSKPLQYFNCLNIQQSLQGAKILLASPNFFKGLEFFNDVKKSTDVWDEVKIITGKKDQNLKNIKVNKDSSIFVDTDLYRDLDIWAGFTIANVYVYEEGIGTYLGSRYQKWNIKGCFVNLSGILGIYNNSIGQNTKVKGVYLYDKLKYQKKNKRKKETLDFPDDFQKLYQRYNSHLTNLFKINKNKIPSNSNVLIYLTSNSRVYDFESNYLQLNNKKNYDLKIFKAHPYVADLYKHFDSNINATMAEILLLELISKKNYIDVYHFSSSVPLYIKSKYVNFINLC